MARRKTIHIDQRTDYIAKAVRLSSEMGQHCVLVFNRIHMCLQIHIHMQRPITCYESYKASSFEEPWSQGTSLDIKCHRVQFVNAFILCYLTVELLHMVAISPLKACKMQPKICSFRDQQKKNRFSPVLDQLTDAYTLPLEGMNLFSFDMSIREC